MYIYMYVIIDYWILWIFVIVFVVMEEFYFVEFVMKYLWDNCFVLMVKKIRYVV